MIKNAPWTYSPERIQEVIGKRPFACGRAGLSLTNEEAERYRNDGVGRNEFAQEIRAAYYRTNGVHDP